MARPTLSRLAAAALVSLLPATRLITSEEGRLLAETTTTPAAPSPVTGARDPAWSPDGSLIAVSLIDQIWVMTKDGQTPRPLITWDGGQPAIERDPAWSADGKRIAFAADRGDGFDLYIVAAGGGTPERVTFLPGDERWPAWTTDGRLVFAHRATDQWDLARVLPATSGAIASRPEPLTDTPYDETEPRISPDGTRVLFVSNRDNDASETDLWLMPLEPASKPSAPESPAADTPANARPSAARGVSVAGNINSAAIGDVGSSAAASSPGVKRDGVAGGNPSGAVR